VTSPANRLVIDRMRRTCPDPSAVASRRAAANTSDSSAVNPGVMNVGLHHIRVKSMPCAILRLAPTDEGPPRCSLGNRAEAVYVGDTQPTSGTTAAARSAMPLILFCCRKDGSVLAITHAHTISAVRAGPRSSLAILHVAHDLKHSEPQTCFH